MSDHAIADEKIFLYETAHTTTVVEHRVPCMSFRARASIRRSSGRAPPPSHWWVRSHRLLHLVLTEPVRNDLADQIHALPSIGDKPPPSKELPDLEKPRDEDPFTPPFVPAEFIGSLTVNDGYFLFLNKFGFLPMQFMLVTKEWKSQVRLALRSRARWCAMPGTDCVPSACSRQVGPLEPEDLFTAWRVVDALRQQGEDVLCFGNIGNRSGASQPHRHLQFIRIPEREGRNGKPTARIPVEEVLEDLTELEQYIEPHQLPLPYRHTYTPLPRPAPTAHILHALYTAHLALLPEGITSYNILLTQHGLHVIPRAERDTVIPLPLSAEVKDSQERKEGWNLSTNALGFAGWFFVDPSKEDVLRDFTPTAVLRNAGVAL